MKAQETTVADIPGASALRYNLNLRNSSLERTDYSISKERQSSLIPTLSYSTENEIGVPTAKIIKFSLEKSQEKIISVAAKNYVNGVIISCDEISVKCELIVSGKALSIQLPRALFPEKIHYGLPINMEMIEEDGFRKPLITIRKMDDKNTAKIAEEFESILAAL